MDKASVLRIVAGFRAALEQGGVHVEKIVLFGSHAEGTQRPESDIDLVVISPDFMGKGYWERIDVLTDAIFAVFEPIEAVAMTPQEWEAGDSFVAQYARSGEVV